MLKKIIIKDGLNYKIKTTKVGNYTKDELFYSNNMWSFKKDDKKPITKVFYDRRNKRDILFIEFKEEEILYTYYIDGLELI